MKFSLRGMLLGFLMFGLGLMGGAYLSKLSSPQAKPLQVQPYELLIDGVANVPVTVTFVSRAIPGAQPRLVCHEATTPFSYRVSACEGYAWIEFGDLDATAQTGVIHSELKIGGKLAYQCDTEIDHEHVKRLCNLGEF